MWLTYVSYATGAEIHQYLKSVSKQYNLDRDVRLNSEVKSAVWDEESGTWKLQILNGTKVVDDWCHVLINGSGVLKSVQHRNTTLLNAELTLCKPLVLASDHWSPRIQRVYVSFGQLARRL